MKTSIEDRLAPPADVAEYLGVSTDRLAQMRYHGSGPLFVKIGKRVMYRWADVRSYVEAQTFQRTDGAR